MSSKAHDEPPAEAPLEHPDEQARRTRTIRFFAVVGMAMVVGIAAILVGVVLNQPSRSGTSTTTSASPSTTPQLPQLAVVLNRTDPVAAMAASNQVVALQAMIQNTPTAARYMALGQAEMSLANQQAALDAFSRAQQLEPSSPDPLVGLAMAEGMSGTTGLAAADVQLHSLGMRFPKSQVVAFNRGWLALYRRDVATVRSAWRRTVALGPTTQLGRAAKILLTDIGKKAGS
jgi:Flp pilus assembly protein TadD